MIKYFICFFILGCAAPGLQNTPNKEGVVYYKYNDPSGDYRLSRETKKQGNKLITRTIIMDPKGKALESSVMLAKLGTVGDSKNIAMLPEASQFSVWFNKKQYKNQMKVLTKERKIVGKINDPDSGESSIEHKLNKGRYFCFFSQLFECIEQQSLLLEARNKRLMLFIIWDSFPFNSEQYEKVPKEVVSLAEFSFSKKMKNELIFELDIGNQILLLHFDRQLKFEKMFWIAQGISIIREGSEE